MAYKSIYRPDNPKKYLGNVRNIQCRSSWERQLAQWADRNAAIVAWSMETVVVRYFDKGNGKHRRYFIDFYLEFNNGKKLLVEVKPRAQTIAPVKKTRVTKRYIKEVQTYATNTSKWDQAIKYAAKHDMTFQVWTEDHLRRLGLKII